MHILGEEEILSIPFNVLLLLIAACPFISFTICLALSIILHYEQAVWTHCEVPNWLPSLSAAVASYTPEKYIWRLLIGIHGTPRMALAIAFKNFLLSSAHWPSPIRPWYRWACHLACGLNLCEIFSLLLIACISSSEDHFLHVLCFTIFAFSGTFYMFTVIWLFHLSGRRRSSKMGQRSFRYKVNCCAGSVASLLFALYFFYRHNRYCEPGVYTLFALAEYALILFNVLFHSTLYYDFHSRHLSLITAPTISAANYNLLPMHSEREDYSEKRVI